MADKKQVKSLYESVESLIGPSAVFDGNIKTDKVVRIDGVVNGDIFAAGVIIGPDAQVKGNIKTSAIFVGGTVYGNIESSESVEIMPKAKVVGDVKTNIFTIAEGAFFEGKSSMLGQQ